MALVETAFSVNVTPSEMPPVIHVSEYDIGRSYTVSIIGENGNAFTIPTGTTATVEGTLNKKVGFSESATVSGNTVTFTLTENMTAQAGKAWCKIKLTLNSEPIQTCAFVLAVDRAGVEADTVIGASGFEQQIVDAVQDWLDEHPPASGGMTEAFKQALLDCFENVAWINDDGQTYYDALYAALYPPVGLVSISATINTDGAVIYEGDSLNSIMPYLTVLANYDDGTSNEVTGYVLSGELNQAVSAVTVLYARKTTVVNVPVTMLMITDVLTLDGILNSRNGHDSTATKWEDLSENKNDFTKVSGANNSVWADDHAIYNGTDRRIKASTNPMIGISQMTFEAVVKITGNGTFEYNGVYWAALFDDADWDETDSLRFATRNNDMLSARLGNTTVLNSTVGINTIVYIAITAVNGAAIAYVNGEAVKTTEISFPPATHKTSRVGGYKSSQNNYFPNAEIYRIGISSRAMTAEEIAERYAFFQDRFNFGGESV